MKSGFLPNPLSTLRASQQTIYDHSILIDQFLELLFALPTHKQTRRCVLFRGELRSNRRRRRQPDNRRESYRRGEATISLRIMRTQPKRIIAVRRQF